MYFVYVLKSRRDGKLYCGLTHNLEKRVKDHNSGFVRATKSRIPLDLVYFETVDTIVEARKKEKYFKSGFGRKYIQGKFN